MEKTRSGKLPASFSREIAERMGYARKVLYSMDIKLNQSIQGGQEMKEEIVGLRSDTRKNLDDEFAEIRKELVSIKDTLARAGIQV